MNDREAPRHPGPFRIPRFEAGFAGIIVAGGFIALGLAALPLAKWFLLAAVCVGIVIAILLRIFRKDRTASDKYLRIT